MSKDTNAPRRPASAKAPDKIPLPKYGEMEKRYDAATRRKLGLG